MKNKMKRMAWNFNRISQWYPGDLGPVEKSNNSVPACIRPGESSSFIASPHFPFPTFPDMQMTRLKVKCCSSKIAFSPGVYRIRIRISLKKNFPGMETV